VRAEVQSAVAGVAGGNDLQVRMAPECKGRETAADQLAFTVLRWSCQDHPRGLLVGHIGEKLIPHFAHCAMKPTGAVFGERALSKRVEFSRNPLAVDFITRRVANR